MPDHLQAAAMRLEMLPVEPWMTHPDNVILGHSDETVMSMGWIITLWGRSEALFQELYLEEIRAANQPQMPNTNRWGRARLIRQLIRFIAESDPHINLDMLRVLLYSQNALNLVRTCICHRNFIGLLREPERAWLFCGYYNDGSPGNFILTSDMIEGTMAALDITVKYLPLFGIERFGLNKPDDNR